MPPISSSSASGRLWRTWSMSEPVDASPMTMAGVQTLRETARRLGPDIEADRGTGLARLHRELAAA